MKKFTLYILLAAMLTGMISCGGSDTPAGDTTSADTTEPEITTSYLDTLITETYEGEEINIILQHVTGSPNVPPEEQTGEAVDDAMYDRDRKIEELLDITLVYTAYEDRGKLRNDVKTSITAGEDVYDIIMTSMADGLNTLAPEGYLTDLMTVSALSLDEAWWSRSMHENLTFNGKQYITSGPISLNYFYAPCIMTFNQRLCDEYQIPNLYEAVLDGKWTLDMYASVTKNVASDLNADGNMTQDDFFAFACDELTGQAFFIGAGGSQTEVGSDGYPVLVMNSAKNIDILDKIISVVAKDSDRLLTEPLKIDGSTIPAYNKTWHFKNARTLFLGYNMSGVITYMRDMQDDYGIIPMPKLDEKQAEYLTYGSPWGPCGLAIPITNAKPEITGTVMEAMAYVSLNEISPLMFNITLKEKISRDENSKLMLDIIYEDVIFDLNGIHNFGSTGNLLRSCAIGAKENFSSQYASSLPSAEEALKKLMDQYNAID